MYEIFKNVLKGDYELVDMLSVYPAAWNDVTEQVLAGESV